MNYGIVAIAGISSRFVGAARAGGGNVAAAASRSFDKAQQFCRDYQIEKAYGTYEELYQDPEIETVYIATTNAGHGREVREALIHGKHVLCEKPLALSEREAAELFALAESRGLFLMEMQKSVFLPVTRLIREYIDGGKLGRLHQVAMSASFAAPAPLWMHEPAQGGVVYGSASYTLEYLDYLIAPQETVVQAVGTKEAGGAVDAVSINLRMDEVLINSRISMRAPAASQADFYFERGCLTIPNYWKARVCQIHTSDGIETRTFPEPFEMRYEVEHARDCIRAGMLQSPVMTADRTVRCCRQVDELIRQI